MPHPTTSQTHGGQQGNWQIRPDCNSGVIVNSSDIIIAQVHCTDGNLKASRARLIASAPDLFDALKDLVEDAECEPCEKCDGAGVNPRCKTDACHACAGAGEIVRHPIWPQFLTNAIAAINRAEGK